MALILSLMYGFRSVGYLDASDDVQYELAYHQDNNYYRAVNAMHLAATTSERWDPIPFAVATVVNPIPRAIWSSKPALLADYYGNYKTEWQTISFIGELIAMFGLVGGIVASVTFGVLVYWLIAASLFALRWPAGIILYMILVLYAYMVMRSILNLSQYVYLPAFALFVFWVMSIRIRRSKKFLAAAVG
jgi:hypothetical protein